jgi:hypothetical protein
LNFTNIFYTTKARQKYSKTKKLLRTIFSSQQLFKLSFDYCSLIASTGQAPAHAPQPRHSSALITYFPSVSTLIAPTGHSASQVPQPMQVSLSITYAISKSSVNLLLYRVYLPLHNITNKEIFQGFFTIFFKINKAKNVNKKNKLYL